tara:strand:- start:109820 stop:110461 length:642 start_codon:yes stop_codon:yes gene_type:complete
MPAAIPSRKNTRFWNFMAKRYAKSQIADQASYDRKLDETRVLLRPDMTLLEIGAGTCSTALVHAPYVARIDAVDLSQNMLDIGAEKARVAGIDNITFTQSSAEEYRAEPESYDMILALSVLHLVQDHRATLTKLHGLMKPGGYLVTSTVCMADMMPAFKVISVPGHALGLLPYLSYFRADTLLNDMATAGFETLTHWRPGPKSAFFVIARKPG